MPRGGWWVSDELLKDADRMRFGNESKRMVQDFMSWADKKTEEAAPSDSVTTSTAAPAPATQTVEPEASVVSPDPIALPSSTSSEPQPAQPAPASFLPTMDELTAGWRQGGNGSQAPSAEGGQQPPATSFIPTIDELTEKWQRLVAPAENESGGASAVSVQAQRLTPLTPSGTPAAMPSARDRREPIVNGMRVAPYIEGDPEAKRAWARSEAERLGIDPDVAERVAGTEGGFDIPARQNQQGAPAYGPYQMYVGGKEQPGLGDEALAAGIDPRDPKNDFRSITFALEHAKKNGWGAFQGAAGAGIGNWEGIRTGPVGVAQGADWRKTWGRDLTPNQINETLATGMDFESAIATCGIAGAVALARAKGDNPNFGETLRMAERMGEWNKDVGMVRGLAGEMALLKKLGVDARSEAVDERRMAQAISAGQPVVVNATGNGGHYYVATDYDAATRTFEFGSSAGILRIVNLPEAQGGYGGRTRFRLDELAALGVGSPTNAIFLDMGGAQ